MPLGRFRSGASLRIHPGGRVGGVRLGPGGARSRFARQSLRGPIGGDECARRRGRRLDAEDPRLRRRHDHIAPGGLPRGRGSIRPRVRSPARNAGERYGSATPAGHRRDTGRHGDRGLVVPVRPTGAERHDQVGRRGRPSGRWKLERAGAAVAARKRRRRAGPGRGRAWKRDPRVAFAGRRDLGSRGPGAARERNLARRETARHGRRHVRVSRRGLRRQRTSDRRLGRREPVALPRRDQVGGAVELDRPDDHPDSTLRRRSHLPRRDHREGTRRLDRPQRHRSTIVDRARRMGTRPASREDTRVRLRRGPTERQRLRRLREWIEHLRRDAHSRFELDCGEDEHREGRLRPRPAAGSRSTPAGISRSAGTTFRRSQTGWRCSRPAARVGLRQRRPWSTQAPRQSTPKETPWSPDRPSDALWGSSSTSRRTVPPRRALRISEIENVVVGRAWTWRLFALYVQASSPTVQQTFSLGLVAAGPRCTTGPRKLHERSTSSWTPGILARAVVSG